MTQAIQQDQLANWKRSNVDEPWKRRVVFEQRKTAIDVVNGLGVMLFKGGVIPGASVVDFRAQCEILRGLSGDQLADGLLKFWDKVCEDLDASKNLEGVSDVTP